MGAAVLGVGLDVADASMVILLAMFAATGDAPKTVKLCGKVLSVVREVKGAWMAPGQRCDVGVGVGVANVARLKSRIGKFPSCPVRLQANDMCEHLHECHYARSEEEILGFSFVYCHVYRHRRQSEMLGSEIHQIQLPLRSTRPGHMFPSLRLFLFLRHQVPQRQIIDNVFDILDPVLQAIAAAAQAVIFEVEHLEASVQVLDKLVDE
jgi:hypothetical protein